MNFTDENGDNSDEFELCDSYEKVIFPTSGQLQDGTAAYIFNSEEHRQSIRVSICRNAGRPCKLSEYFPGVYQTECKQQMMYRELLSLSLDGQPFKQRFGFPSHCSCVVKRIT